MATARKVSRRTLIYLLRLAASSYKGVPRKQIIKNNLLAKELNRVQASHWEEKGLFGLLHEEILPTKGRSAKVFFITSAGRDFLRRVGVDRRALPEIPRGKQPYQSLEAKRYAQRKSYQKCRRRRNQRRYYQRLRNPKYDAATYDAPLDASRYPAIGAKGWSNLPVVTKIMLLRQRVRQRNLRERFAVIAREVNSN
jgi:hypothetical protein